MLSLTVNLVLCHPPTSNTPVPMVNLIFIDSDVQQRVVLPPQYNEVQRVPYAFNNLVVNYDNIKEEITSLNNYKKVKDMLEMGSSYVQDKPVIAGKKLQWTVMHEC